MIRVAAMQYNSCPWLVFFIRKMSRTDFSWRNVELAGACFMGIFDLSFLLAILGILLAASDPAVTGQADPPTGFSPLLYSANLIQCQTLHWKHEKGFIKF